MPLDYSPLFPLTVAQPNGPIRPSYPFFDKFGDVAHVVFTQEMVTLFPSYAPLALNSTATIQGVSVYMVGDTDPDDIEAGVSSFDRSYANVPSSHFDYESIAITYPGYFASTVNLRIRQPYTQTVMAQIQYEYFLTGAGQTYTTAAAIPMVDETRVTDTNGLNVAILSGVDVNNGDGDFTFATTPSYADYLDLVTDDTTPATYSIVESCKIVQYLGNIWCRETRRVKAR